MEKKGTFNVWLVDKAPRSDYYWGEGSMFAVANYLTEYFNQVCQHPSCEFTNAAFFWKSGSVAEHELVIYFLASQKRSIIYNTFGQNSVCNAPSGGTFQSPNGMVSEVYMDAMEGDANYCRLVANLAFHELMHNKLDAVQSGAALKDLHSEGGGGLAQYSVVRGTHITQQNIALMAGALSKKIKQYTAEMG